MLFSIALTFIFVNILFFFTAAFYLVFSKLQASCVPNLLNNRNAAEIRAVLQGIYETKNLVLVMKSE